MTAKIEVNLRRSASVKAEIAGAIKNGEFLIRTGENPNGWTRLVYSGQTVYAVTSFLISEADYNVILQSQNSEN